MAYNFIPTKPQEITEKIKGDISQEISAAFIQVTSEFPKIPDPFALDISKPSSVKVTRKLQDALDIKTLNKKFKLIKLSFGEGSRGGRGTGNKGNLFEAELAEDINLWWSDSESISKKKTKQVIEGIASHYGIDKWGDLFVDAEGALNKPRPLMISGNSILISPGIKDIGDIVTDITLRKGKSKSSPAGVYLSLKYSTTVTFFNAGTKKYLTDADLKSGLIRNKDGLALIELFGLDNAIFCSVFNGTGKNLPKVNTTKNINKTALENLIKSGIGYGYHLIHKKTNEIVSKEITEQYRDKASKVESVTCFYGGKTGTGARVDIEVVTPVFILKFNFRNKQGGKFISHLMCDYSYR